MDLYQIEIKDITQNVIHIRSQDTPGHISTRQRIKVHKSMNYARQPSSENSIEITKKVCLHVLVN